MSHWAAWTAVGEIRQRLYDHIQSLSLRYFEDKQTGQLMSRVVNDTANFEQLIAHAVPTILVNGCILVGVSAILFSISPRLALNGILPLEDLVATWSGPGVRLNFAT